MTTVHVEETHTGERVKFQMWPGGSTQVRIFRGGQVAEWIQYRQADRIHRIGQPAEEPA